MQNKENNRRELRNPTRVGTESVAGVHNAPAERKFLRPDHSSDGSRHVSDHSAHSGSLKKAS
jgi:hypothetical protein